MLIKKDIYRLDLFRDGTPLDELMRDSSGPYIKELEAHDIIFIDPVKAKVYLTPKGKVVRKIGLEKYLELEKVEQKYLTVDSSRLRFRNRLFLGFMLLLIFSLGYFLMNNPVL
ncbi:MAG: hypothetical protein WBL27_08120 [Salinimicrobium sp.]